MKSETFGNCLLCNRYQLLKDSHIWPAFTYKSWVGDLAKGGQFVDLCRDRMRTTNWQHKRKWFCNDCEQAIGKFEAYGSSLCNQVIKDGNGTVCEYDDRLLGFFASMSFRMAHFICEGKPIRKEFLPALKAWRDLLLDKKKDVGQFSQHGFIILGTDGPRILSGDLDPRIGIVICRLGPFFIFGQLKTRNGLPIKKIRIMDQSKIHAKGGAIHPINEFRVGNALPQNNITMDWMKYLVEERGEMFRRLMAFKEKNPNYWKQQEEKLSST